MVPFDDEPETTVHLQRLFADMLAALSTGLPEGKEGDTRGKLNKRKHKKISEGNN